MISFKGAHFSNAIILYAVFFYVRYGVSYIVIWKKSSRSVSLKLIIQPFYRLGIDGIETAHMIRNVQLSEENIPAYKQFMALAE